jgi:phage shock protein PspC (stress-responsive transcriptional regulator)
MDAKRLWGTILVLLGFFILIWNLGWIGEFGWWSFSGKYIFPASLILLGAFFIYMQKSKSAATAGASSLEAAVPSQRRELRRSLTDRKICGVCGGIARHFEVDPTIVRVAFVFMVFASFGWGILLYILLCLLMPEEKPTASQI